MHPPSTNNTQNPTAPCTSPHSAETHTHTRHPPTTTQTPPPKGPPHGARRLPPRQGERPLHHLHRRGRRDRDRALRRADGRGQGGAAHPHGAAEPDGRVRPDRERQGARGFMGGPVGRRFLVRAALVRSRVACCARCYVERQDPGASFNSRPPPTQPHSHNRDPPPHTHTRRSSWPPTAPTPSTPPCCAPAASTARSSSPSPTAARSGSSSRCAPAR